MKKPKAKWHRLESAPETQQERSYREACDALQMEMESDGYRMVEVPTAAQIHDENQIMRSTCAACGSVGFLPFLYAREGSYRPRGVCLHCGHYVEI